MTAADASSHCLIDSMSVCMCVCRVTDLTLAVKCVDVESTLVYYML